MDFDRSKHNVIKYLPTNNDENIWGMSISGIGFQSIDPKGSYPLKGHPIGYTFNPDRGRIIDEFALVYIKVLLLPSTALKRKYQKETLSLFSPDNGIATNLSPI